MAKCEVIPQPFFPPPPVYRLELTQDEAEIVRALLGHLGGTQAGQGADAWQALVDAGVPMRYITNQVIQLQRV